MKEIALIHYGTDFDVLRSDAILAELRAGYRALEGMYHFLLDAQARVEETE